MVCPRDATLPGWRFPSPVVPYGLAVRIPGFHPGGPGSTPGMGMLLCRLSPSKINLAFAAHSCTKFPFRQNQVGDCHGGLPQAGWFAVVPFRRTEPFIRLYWVCVPDDFPTQRPAGPKEELFSGKCSKLKRFLQAS